MPLNKGSLSNALSKIFQGQPSYPIDAKEAGQKWAAAYRQYAAAAMAGPTAAVAAALAGAESLLASALQAGFTAAKSAGPGGIAVLAPSMDAAFVAFWLAKPFATPPPPAPPAIAGVVTVAPPGVLTGLLTATFATGAAPGVTAAVQASAIATVLDTWTKTVMVVNTPVTPPGPPSPPAPLV